MSAVGWRERRKLKVAATYVLLSVVAVAFLAPLVWTVLTSLKTPLEASSIPPVWKFRPIWSNYVAAWNSQGFGAAFWNTTYESLLSVLLSLVLAIPAAYSLARFRMRGKETVGAGLIVIRMLPEMLILIPLYALYRRSGLYDTPLGVILAFQIFNLPYSIWLLRQFIAQVPVEIEQAARVDGCTTSQVLRLVTLPLIAPGVVASAILDLIIIWTNLLIPLALTQSNSPMVATAIANFQGYGSFNEPLIAAASIIAIAPQFVFFLFAQRYIIQGLTLGAVKG